MGTEAPNLKTDPTRILVIEDEPELLDLLAVELKSSGFEIITATNGKEGLTAAVLHKPDVALCDIMMPEMDGYQFLREIRFEHPELDMMQIMFLTAKGDAQDVMTGLALGVDDYLTKPFDFGLLISHIWARINQIKRITSFHDAQLVKVYKTLAGTKAKGEVETGPKEAKSLFEQDLAHDEPVAPEASKPVVAVCSSDASERDEICRAAEAAGFQPFETASGEEMASRLAEIKPRILFLSHQTKDVAGFYLANKLKTETGDALPIVFLPGASAPMSANQQMPRSYDSFLNAADIKSKLSDVCAQWGIQADG